MDDAVIEQSSIPQWIRSSFRPTPGMDSLGLQSITIDRIMPLLVPGILALSRRARYFSFYPFLIDEHRQRFPNASQEELSRFIKEREFELSLAVNLCPRCERTATGAVGSSKSGPIVHRGDQRFERAESVESFLGGYGLYYRTPLRDIGLIAPRGEIVSDLDEPLPRDVLRPGIAYALADQYRDAISRTLYYQEYFTGTQAIPREVLVELAEQGCLCRLEQHHTERELIRQALLGMTQASTVHDHAFLHQMQQRRRSVALLIWILGGGAGEKSEEEKPDQYFRHAVWDQDIRHQGQDTPLSQTVAQWSAVAARDYMEIALTLIFNDFCRSGLARQPSDGMSEDELSDFLEGTLLDYSTVRIGDQDLMPGTSMLTHQFAELVAEAAQERKLEEVRSDAVACPSALSGLVLLLALNQRLDSSITERHAWKGVANQSSNWQPGLSGLLYRLREHLEQNPHLGETLAFVTNRFVIEVHERNAFSKLPNFTFRFRWESDRLKFYAGNAGHGGVSLPDSRLNSVSSLSIDLGLLCHGETGLLLTPTGNEFVEEVLR